MEIKFTIQDMSDDVLNELDKTMERALYASGTLIQEGAVRAISGQYDEDLKAVDTGRLRASISFITPEHPQPPMPQDAPEGFKMSDMLSGQADKNSVVFGSNVEYASYVENGTSRMPARPFLRKGLDMKMSEISDRVNQIFKGEL